MSTAKAILRRLAASGGRPLPYQTIVREVVQSLGVAESEVERAVARLASRGRLRLLGADWPTVVSVSIQRQPLPGPVVASVAGVAALACSTTPTLPSHKEAGAAIAFCQRTVGGQLIWASCAPQEVAAPTPKTPVPLLAPLPRKEASASPAAVQPAGPTPQPAVPPKEPAPAMRPAAIGPSPVPPRSVFWSRSVYFAAGADRSPALNNAVEAVASRFGALPEARVVIVGMTDATGSATLNAALAHRRAEAVRQRLIAAGVPAHAITSYADTSASRPPPVAQADQPKAAGAVYRRADILIRWRPAATA